MGCWALVAQLGVGSIGALLFLSTVADALMREEAHLADRVRARQREEMELQDEAAIVHAAAPPQPGSPCPQHEA